MTRLLLSSVHDILINTQRSGGYATLDVVENARWGWPRNILLLLRWLVVELLLSSEASRLAGQSTPVVRVGCVSFSSCKKIKRQYTVCKLYYAEAWLWYLQANLYREYRLMLGTNKLSRQCLVMISRRRIASRFVLSGRRRRFRFESNRGWSLWNVNARVPII